MRKTAIKKNQIIRIIMEHETGKSSKDLRRENQE